MATALCLCGAFLLCRCITRSPAGRVLIAIRDSETRVLFSGYSPAAFKLFVFVVSAALAGVAGALYAPQVGIITPAKIGVLPSIEMIIWVAVGGRGTLLGPVVGALGRELAAEPAHHALPRSLAARAGRALRRRWCSSSRTGWSAPPRSCSRAWAPGGGAASGVRRVRRGDRSEEAKTPTEVPTCGQLRAP